MLSIKHPEADDWRAASDPALFERTARGQRKLAPSNCLPASGRSQCQLSRVNSTLLISRS